MIELFDTYNRKARFFPGLLTLLPAIFSIVICYPVLLKSNLGATLVGFLASCGLLYGLTVFCRTCGKRVEKRLLQQWGGWPTTIWLRHSDGNLPPQTKQRYHQFLTQHVPGLRLPSASQEARDPENADKAYASGVKWLVEQTRGKKFSLILKENIEYGFRRNLRGIRWLGIICCLVGILIPFFWEMSKAGNHGDFLIMAWITVISASAIIKGVWLIDLVAVGIWLFMVNDKWVREGGDQYARALLAACDTL